MKFDTVFVENKIFDLEKTQKIIGKTSYNRVVQLDSYEEVFGKSFKPYLHKRTNLNLFIAQKKGQLVKEAPNAYGLGKDDIHYYFIHAYNCIYECQYCYLQGYFHSPDLVFFINHEEIIECMTKKMQSIDKSKIVWFHAGEFSDSLALSHITEEWQYYWPFFEKHKNARLELRTKSVNLRQLKKLKALPNIIVSFSLSTSKSAKKFDLKTPSTEQRLKAINALHHLGYKIAIHLDPIIYDENFVDSYQELLHKLNSSIPLSELSYLSIGVVRFTPEVFRHVKSNYPDSDIFQSDMIKTKDNMIRYSQSLRLFILKCLKKMSMSLGASEEIIYFCME